MRQVRDIVIIGNGPAGNTAASTIRKYAPSILIHLLSQEACPEYSPCFFPDYISGAIDRKSLFLKSMEDYKEEKIETVFGRHVHGIDPDRKRVVFEGGERSYGKLVLATGTQTVLPGIAGATLDGVFPVKTLGDAEAISRYPGTTALVVGAGPIGVEVALALGRKGRQVYLLEKEECILSRILETDLARLVESEIAANGMAVITGAEIVRILGEEKVRAVLLSSQKTLDCDMVVFSTGVKPNTEFARKAGIEVGDLGGIVTGPTMMTHRPDIYACGDCAEIIDPFTGTSTVSALWPNAVLGGKITGLNIVGIPRRMPDPIRLQRLTVFGLKICVMGYPGYALTGMAARELIPGKVSGGGYRVLLADGRLVGMQIVGTGDPGSLFPVIYKREKLSRVVQAIGSPERAGGNPMFRSFFRSWRPVQALNPGRS